MRNDGCRDLDVLPDCEGRDEVEELEDEPHGIPPIHGQLTAWKRSYVLPSDSDGTPIRPVDAADDVEKGGLAGTRGTEDRDKLALLHGERHTVEGTGTLSAGGVVLDYVVKVNNHRRSFRVQESRWLHHGFATQGFARLVRSIGDH